MTLSCIISQTQRVIDRIIVTMIPRIFGSVPIRRNPIRRKVHSMSKCSFVEKIVLRIFNYIFSPNFLLL